MLYRQQKGVFEGHGISSKTALLNDLTRLFKFSTHFCLAKTVAYFCDSSAISTAYAFKTVKMMSAYTFVFENFYTFTALNNVVPNQVPFVSLRAF